MAWNGFPANHRSAILKKLKLKYKINEPTTNSKTFSGNDSNNTSDENIPKIWVRVPFLGKQGEYLVKELIRKNTTSPYKAG